MKTKLSLIILCYVLLSFPISSFKKPVIDTDQLNIKELQWISYDIFKTNEINLQVNGYHIINGRNSRIPAGSTLDKEKGFFYWSPGPGFIGDYELLFESKKLQKTKRLKIHISPRYGEFTAHKVDKNLARILAVDSPFGSFDSPVEGSQVSSSIPVTGWALDDQEVESVKIYRDPLTGESRQQNGYVYIGEAVFIEGARPDVEAIYPDYPFNYRAGWGYMLLTNFLPNSGNGIFVLRAIAVDRDGNTVEIGSKTINCDNANAVKPFGAIDTPVQGGAISGNNYINFGWALTPQPNIIPFDGSTIVVYIDSVPQGSPVYNQYRSDIESLFPSYANSSGAVGYYYIDTSKMTSGIHQIGWSVTDSGGNIDGIGSRFFFIENGYTLNITKGAGIDGTPDTGSDLYNKGDKVNYNYSLQGGYKDLITKVDGNTVSSSGTIIMNMHHTLSVSASTDTATSFILDVSRATGINGTPISGTTVYNRETVINYSYSLQAGYTNLAVTLDGTKVASSGYFIMDRGHTLVAVTGDHIPVQTHPRLWINKERMDFFKLAKQNSTAEWIEILAQCNLILDSDPSNDPYGIEDSPQLGTAPLALVYLLTKDSRYADKAMELMDRAPSSIYDKEGNTIYGDPDHHFFEYIGLAYDWLYDYPKMTAAKKTEYCNKMISISDSFWQSYGPDATGTDSDANLLSGLIHFIYGTAMYGDTARAPELIERGWNGWEKGYGPDGSPSNKEIIKKSLGGVYPTGFGYFMSTDIIGISGYWMSFLTAYGHDIGKTNAGFSQFWSNIAHSFFHLNEPDRVSIYPSGSWQDPSIITEQAWLYQFVQISSYFNKLYGADKEAAYLRGYSKQFDLYRNAWFTEFFFSTLKETGKDPFSGELPLIRFAKSPDFLMFRDNWSKNSIWGIFIGDGFIPLDHQSPDHGHFSLWKGDGYLTKGARTYDALLHGDFFNSLSIESNCSYNGESCSGTSLFNSEKSASITRHRENQSSPPYAYSMLEGDGQWNDHPSEWEAVSNVKTYRRHFFWMNNYAIVFDRLRTKTPGKVKYRLRAMTEPYIQNNTISQLSLNGKYKLLSKTVEPENGTFNKINESELWSGVPDWVINYSERRWQTTVSFSPQNSINILNIMQMGPSSMNQFDIFEHISNGDNSGIRLGSLVIIFYSKEGLRNQISYTISSGNGLINHFITDLQSGNYTITVNGSSTFSLNASDGDNSLFFKTDVSAGPLTILVKKN